MTVAYLMFGALCTGAIILVAAELIAMYIIDKTDKKRGITNGKSI